MSSNVFELPAPDDETARELTPADWARLERNAAEIFSALGLDLDTPGTRDTPRRFVRALFGLILALGHPFGFAWLAVG